MAELSTDRIRQIVTEAVSSIMDESTNTNAGKRNRKPEHMTHLRGDELVYKDHPRIAFRGAIDALESEIILVQVFVGQKGLETLVQDLEEIIKAIRWTLRCEVSGEPVGEIILQGLSTEELREHSHHPGKYYGMKHFLPTCRHGEVVSWLNRLRTRARETELSAYRAFRMEHGDVERQDIIRILNRLSSLFWIMMFKYLTGRYES